MNKTKRTLTGLTIAILSMSILRAQNVNVTNPTTRPVNVHETGATQTSGAQKTQVVSSGGNAAAVNTAGELSISTSAAVADALASNAALFITADGTNASAPIAVFEYRFNGTSWDRARGAIAPVKSAAKEASHVLKASAGSLIEFACSSDTDQWILIIDSATVPANGAVTLLYPPIHVPANGNVHLTFPNPLTASAGISVCNSNANSFTKTIGGSDCIYEGQVQ